MLQNIDENFEAVLENFPIDIHSTEKVNIGGLKQGTRVFNIDLRSPLIPRDANVGSPFIVDTPSGMTIACHPHVVGENLGSLCLDCAGEFIRVLRAMNLFESGHLTVLQILRAAPGYRMTEVLPKNTPIIWIRAEYRAGGYRSHFNETRKIEITYRDYSAVDPDVDQISTILIPDTFATGVSAENAVIDLLGTGVKPRKIILYGFISIPALTRLGELASENSIELISYAIGNMMQVAYNNYDMPMYGLDESLYSATGELKPMGSIVDSETLRTYLPGYVAGLDQPGDWSERQSTLSTGHGHERGDIIGHLTKSKKLIESLREINSRQPWYNDFHDTISSRELEKLENALETSRKTGILDGAQEFN